MPKGEYLREDYGWNWQDDEIEWLRRVITSGMSYSQLAGNYANTFKDRPRKSRNAILGKATRLGIRDQKTGSWGGKVKTVKRAKPNKGTGRTRADRIVAKAAAPTQFDNDGLRSDEFARLPSDVFSGHRKLTKADIAERKKGKLPSIVEKAPTSSKPIFETDHDDCKWPTSHEVRDMSVCGAPATHGAYCEKHAQLAYRAMPTRKRNASFSRRGFQEERARISQADAQWIADHVLDDEVTIAPIEHKLLEFTPGTGRPFNGNKGD